MIGSLPCLSMLAVGWSHLCAALLIISGGSKLVDPEPTRGALKATGLPSTTVAAMTLGVWEIVAGAVGLAFGGVVGGIMLATTYLGFAGFVTFALVRDLPIQSCGCFGRDDTPPTWLHVAVNMSAAAAGIWIAVAGTGDLLATLGEQPLAGIPYIGLMGIGVYALYLLLAELPQTLSLTTSPSA